MKRLETKEYQKYENDLARAESLPKHVKSNFKKCQNSYKYLYEKTSSVNILINSSGIFVIADEA